MYCKTHGIHLIVIQHNINRKSSIRNKNIIIIVLLTIDVSFEALNTIDAATHPYYEDNEH